MRLEWGSSGVYVGCTRLQRRSGSKMEALSVASCILGDKPIVFGTLEVQVHVL